MTELPKCVTVERIVFRNVPERYADVPGAFAITVDGKEWRLSEGEITRALNAQPIVPICPDKWKELALRLAKLHEPYVPMFPSDECRRRSSSGAVLDEIYELEKSSDVGGPCK